jgi:sensor c-di-GMP phosphodiesterase-like protein
MHRRDRLLVVISLTAFVGVAVVFGSMLWLLRRDWLVTEEKLVGGLAQVMGERTQNIIQDTRDLLARLNELSVQPCGPAHLQALDDAAASRPHLRSIGYWRAADRQCGVGFLQSRALMPPRADRIYESGVIAWWPSRHTEVGGVRLFLMRLGDHDAALDPRLLLEMGPLEHRQVTLWVEGLRMASHPGDAVVPDPSTVAAGVNIDRDGGHVVSRFSLNMPLPIEVVAIEPIDRFWGRHQQMLVVGSVLGLVLTASWLAVVLSYSRQRLGLAGEFRHALAQGRIEVEYQPIIELATGRCVSAEALARWTRDNGESVTPDVFISIAEKEGFASDLTLAVLDQVLRDLSDLRPHAPELTIHLNLSAQDLRDPSFCQTLSDRLHAADLPARALSLEITERALVDGDTARLMIQVFREHGHEVAVDDFGTGYSSLSYLQTFELDVLKVDKSFVAAIGSGAATSHVIIHIVEMARALGLRTVVEGVETEDQRRWLVEHGVDCGQGFLFSRPVSIGALTGWLQSRAA